MSNVTLRWIGDLDQDKREQAGCVSSSSDQYRPKKIELKLGQKEIRIGRINTKTPPDYPIESCINSRMISRNHSTIERSAKGGPILYDHSMNGTYVNYVRVMGSVTLKHGDVVCFGHLNGANLKPGEPVALFYSDLKYRVELSDNPSTNDVAANAGSGKKKKSHFVQHGSTVSSTQHSDGEDELSIDSGEDSKRSRASASLHKSSTSAHRHKSFKKPVNNIGKRKVEEQEDEEEDHDDDESGEEDDENGFGDSITSKRSSKIPKKRSNGTEKTKKPVQHNSGIRKISSGKSDHQSKDKRSRKSGKSGGGHDADEGGSGGDMFHYDSEECSARPCKQPQDVAIDWIQCDKCTLWYHQVCVGLKPSDANVDTYYCPSCKK